MGRWLKKLENMPAPILTKPTEPSFVSSVSAHSSPSRNNNENALSLVEFVTQCCKGLNADPQQVIERLLSADDEHDIINGRTPDNALKLHIEFWMANGMPNYSGKAESRDE